MPLTEASEHLDVEPFDRCDDVKCAYLYCDAFYLLELCEGAFWTIVDRSDICTNSLSESEQSVYISFNQMSGYSEQHEPVDTHELERELTAVCANHSYANQSANELAQQIGDSDINRRWYL